MTLTGNNRRIAHERTHMVYGMLGVLIAGGQSRRFGSPKALARLNGRTFAERVVASLIEITGGDVVAIVRDETDSRIIAHLHSLGLQIVVDKRHLPCRGPPRGLASVFLEYRPREVVFVGVDYPYIRPHTLRSIVLEAQKRRAEALTPLLLRNYPVVGVGYARGSALEKLLEACSIKRQPLKVRMTDLYRASRSVVTHWSIHTNDPLELYSINRPEDLSNPNLADLDALPGVRPGHNTDYYWSALNAYAKGKTQDAVSLFNIEADLYYITGLGLFGLHARKDANVL